MSNEAWFSWGIPIVALVFGAISLFIGWLGERDFNKRYGRSSK